MTWNQVQMKLKIPNFHNMKKAYWHQTALEIFKFKNRPPPVGATTKMDFQVSLGFLDSALTLELFLQCWIWPLHSFCGQRQPLVSFQRLNGAGHRPRDRPKKPKAYILFYIQRELKKHKAPWKLSKFRSLQRILASANISSIENIFALLPFTIIFFTAFHRQAWLQCHDPWLFHSWFQSLWAAGMLCILPIS